MKCCACNQPVNVKGDTTKFYEPLCLQMLEIALETLEAVSRNSCCEKCQETKSYTLAILEKLRNLNGEVEK